MAVSRRSFSEANLKGRIFDLLETCFPGIGKAAARVPLDGGRWEDVSTPFVVEHDDGQFIAHVGLLPLPVVMHGKRQLLGGVHAVCTHPAHRRQGHCRALMDDMLEWSRDQYQTLLLFTGIPTLYQRFGFRVLPECRFDMTVRSAGGREGFRPFDARHELALLQELVATREPVSNSFGITSEDRGVLSFNLPDANLWYAADLNAIAWMEMRETTLRIYDIIAPRIPRFRDILACWPARVERVETLFVPDRLDVSATAHEHQHDGYLMVRGPFPVEQTPFIVPPTAHC